MKKKTPIIHNPADPLHELQTLWDSREERLAALAASPAAEPLGFHPAAARRGVDASRLHHAVLWASCIVSLGVLLAARGHFATDRITHAVGVLLALCCLAGLVYCLAVRVRASVTLPRPQVALYGLALFAMILFSACSPVGDNYTMSQNHHGRAEAVGCVYQLLGVQP